MCPDIKSIFATSPGEVIAELLVDDALDAADFLVLMAALKVARPAAFNRALCCLYEIACYRNDESCFAEKVQAADLDKWFISTISGSEFSRSTDARLAALYDSCDKAEAAAVQGLDLEAIFFGTAVTA